MRHVRRGRVYSGPDGSDHGDDDSHGRSVLVGRLCVNLKRRIIFIQELHVLRQQSLHQLSLTTFVVFVWPCPPPPTGEAPVVHPTK